MAVEQKRLFVGGLHLSVTEQEVRDRFSRHGTISSVEIKTKKDLRGNPVKTFAYLDICLPESELKKCMSTYNNAKWKGNIMQIQLAKESFLTKLNQERAEMVSPSKSEVPEKASSPSFRAVAEKRLSENLEKFGASDFNVKGKVPGTLVEGEKNWVVGKYGRVLPIVYIRRKDKQKVVCYDPSKYSHHVKRLKDEGRTEEGGDVPPLSKLTWQLPEGDTENTLKRKGVFPQGRPLMIHRKRIKDAAAVRREQLIAGTLPASRTTARARRQYNSDSSVEDLFDDDDDSSDDNFAMPYHHHQGDDILVKDAGDHDEDSQSSDFEIVVESHTSRPSVNASSISSINSSSVHSSHAHGILPGSVQLAGMSDDSDRDSVDTDEICSSFKTLSARAPNVSEIHNRKEDAGPSDTEFKDEPPGRSKGMKASSEQDGGKDEHDIEKMQSKGDVTMGSVNQSKKRSAAPEEIKKVKVRKSSQAGEGPVVTSSYHSGSSDEDACENESEVDIEHLMHQDVVLAPKRDGFAKETADSSLDFEGLTSEGSILQQDCMDDTEPQSSDPDEDVEGKCVGMNPVARFDFEPLILDRTVLNRWNRASGCGQAISMDTQQTCPALSGVGDGTGTDDERTSHLVEEEEEEEEEKEEGATGSLTSDDADNETSKVPHKNAANECNVQTENTSKPDRFDTGSTSCSEPSVSTASPEEGAKTETPKKLSKAAKKQLARELAEKQRLANERRLESAKLQQRALLDRQAAIRGALAAVDSKDKKQGKHITFDSDDDDGDVEDNSGAILPVAVPLSESKPVEAARQKKHGQISLFGSDGESSDSQGEDDGDDHHDDNNDDDDDDDQRFRIKPQYEGTAGQKLREMEERYGGDDRFKLSQHFLDDEEVEKDDAVKDDTMIVTQDEVGRDLQEEKQRSLAILQAMMGTEAVKAVKSKEPNFKDPGLLHYDPSREEHSKYEIKGGKDDESDAKKLEREMQREKRKLEEERAKIPEVSKEKFFEVSSNLKDAFSTGGHQETGEGGGMFNFFGPDDAQSGVEEDDQKDPEPLDLASSLFPSKRFKYDSSDTEEEEEEEEEEGDEKMEADDSNEKNQNTAKEPELGASTTCTFFFQPKDQRLEDGAETFCRPKDQAAMVNAWEEVKAQLQNDFRKRHRRAVRDQKASKKWTKKSTKAKK
ncbi:nucleolar protein 8-like [Diadema antillarum]|uniref:nucleolar protein 8-like n=1 Tax=Diadema antillarum TaxID=105358 RepID=UPI003A896199